MASGVQSRNFCFMRDMNNIIIYWNRGAEEHYGWTADEVVGKITR